MENDGIIEEKEEIKIQENKYEKNKKMKSDTLKNFKNLILKIIILILICYITFGLIFGFVRMPTSYMSPAITEGDLLLFYRLDKNFELEDVVLFEKDNKKYISRIIAKEGQTVDINEEGQLLIDGYPEEFQAFYKTEKEETSSIVFPYRVEKGQYFVLNDYRLQKQDSRIFGVVLSNEIKGKVYGRLQIRNI